MTGIWSPGPFGGPKRHLKTVGKLVRVEVPLSDAFHMDSHTEFETLWAETLLSKCHRIDNIPFHAYNLSAEDLVEALSEGGDPEVLQFVRVVKRGGHSTFRVSIQPDVLAEASPLLQQLTSGLATLGCTTERATEVVWALDSPPRINPEAIIEMLSIGVEERLLEFDIGYAAEDADRANALNPIG